MTNNTISPHLAEAIAAAEVHHAECLTELAEARRLHAELVRHDPERFGALAALETVSAEDADRFLQAEVEVRRALVEMKRLEIRARNAAAALDEARSRQAAANVSAHDAALSDDGMAQRLTRTAESFIAALQMLRDVQADLAQIEGEVREHAFNLGDASRRPSLSRHLGLRVRALSGVDTRVFANLLRVAPNFAVLS